MLVEGLGVAARLGERLEDLRQDRLEQSRIESLQPLRKGRIRNLDAADIEGVSGACSIGGVLVIDAYLKEFCECEPGGGAASRRKGRTEFFKSGSVDHCFKPIVEALGVFWS